MSEQRVDNLNKAISVLIQGVTIAQSKGAYTFQESSIISEALSFLDSVNEKKGDSDQIVGD